MTTYLLLALAAFLAGGMNAVAGGGSFLTFPALIFAGVPPIVANASNTVALFPGSFASAWAYRDKFRNFEGINLATLLTVTVAGGITGAILLLVTSQHAFDVVVPWLLLAASLIFAFGPRLAPLLRQFVIVGPFTFLVLQFFVSIYGGYFGAAVGIVSMALWGLLGRTDIHEMNAAKTLLTGTMNAAAVVCFVLANKITWPETLVMMAAAIAGGYLGAHGARRVKASYLRAAVIVISFGVTAIFFLRGS